MSLVAIVFCLLHIIMKFLYAVPNTPPLSLHFEDIYALTLLGITDLNGRPGRELNKALIATFDGCYAKRPRIDGVSTSGVVIMNLSQGYICFLAW